MCNIVTKLKDSVREVVKIEGSWSFFLWSKKRPEMALNDTKITSEGGGGPRPSSKFILKWTFYYHTCYNANKQ